MMGVVGGRRKVGDIYNKKKNSGLWCSWCRSEGGGLGTYNKKKE
jgi:hypothetical protein